MALVRPGLSVAESSACPLKTRIPYRENISAQLHPDKQCLQECAAYREEVVAAGGLLVIGTSLNESPRIELQLRGRAGRQVRCA